jgi:hypothetical protein
VEKLEYKPRDDLLRDMLLTTVFYKGNDRIKLNIIIYEKSMTKEIGPS